MLGISPLEFKTRVDNLYKDFMLKADGGDTNDQLRNISLVLATNGLCRWRDVAHSTIDEMSAW